MTSQPLPDLEPAALEACPFCGSPASLEHDSDHHGEWFNLGCSRHWEAVADDEPSCPGGRLWCTAGLDEEAGAIAAWNRRAARSVPEAGKAVDAAVTEGRLEDKLAEVLGVKQYPSFAALGFDELLDIVRDRLASVPAPSGTEPAQAVPAEDVASLPQKLRSLAAQIDPLLLGGPDARLLNEAAAALTSLSAERDEARSGLAELDQVFDKLWEADRRAIKLWQEATGKDHIWPDRTKMTLWLLERLTASEAEAASLRRKLEEANRDHFQFREAVKQLYGQTGLNAAIKHHFLTSGASE